MEPLDRDELQEGITVANEEVQRSQTSQFHTSISERTCLFSGVDLIFTSCCEMLLFPFVLSWTTCARTHIVQEVFMCTHISTQRFMYTYILM